MRSAIRHRHPMRHRSQPGYRHEALVGQGERQGRCLGCRAVVPTPFTIRQAA